MRDDVISTRSAGFGAGDTPLPDDEYQDDRGFSSYAGELYSALDRGSRQVTAYLTGQYQQAPRVMGAAAAAAVGAAAGVLIARSQARRRRKTDAERIADALSAIPALISSRVPSVGVEEIRHRGSDVLEATRLRGGAITDAALHRGSEVLGATRDMGSTISEKVPEMRRRPRVTSASGDLRSKVRGGVELVPIAVSLVRNPLVRDMVVRAVTRRPSGRRMFGR